MDSFNISAIPKGILNTTGLTQEEIMAKIWELIHKMNGTIVVEETPNATHVFRHANRNPDFELAKKLGMIYLWFAIIASVIGVLGNILVLIVGSKIGNSRSKITNCKLLILHLATCDLLFAILQVLLISAKFSSETWILGGTFGCKVIRSGMQMGSNVAIGTILFIAIERYRGIVVPFRPGLSRNGIIIGLCFTWLGGFVAIIPSVIKLSISENGYCVQDWDSKLSDGPKIYALVLLFVFFLLPMLVISVLYGGMINVLRKPVEERLPGANNLNLAQLKSRRRDDIRIVTILASVVVMFAICVFPLRLFWVVYQFEGSSFNAREYGYWNFFGLLPYPFHVAVNPIIYSIVDRNFRKGIRKFFWKLITNHKCDVPLKSRMKSTSSALTEIHQINLIEMPKKKQSY